MQTNKTAKGFMNLLRTIDGGTGSVRTMQYILNSNFISCIIKIPYAMYFMNYVNKELG